MAEGADVGLSDLPVMIRDTIPTAITKSDMSGRTPG